MSDLESIVKAVRAGEAEISNKPTETKTTTIVKEETEVAKVEATTGSTKAAVVKEATISTIRTEILTATRVTVGVNDTASSTTLEETVAMAKETKAKVRAVSAIFAAQAVT